MAAAELIRATRFQRRLSQAELARRAKTTQNYISRIERGAVSPSISTIERLIHAMGRRLVLGTEPLPTGNVDAAALRARLRERPPEERVREAMALSAFTTAQAAQGTRSGEA